MYNWQIVLKERYYYGYKILIVEGANNIQEVLDHVGCLDDIISITKILGPDD